MNEVEQQHLPWRRDPREVEVGLGRWARAFLGRQGKLSDLRIPDSGMSSDTVLFRLDGEGLVARLAPAPGSYPTFPTYDLGLQAQVIGLVHERTAVPVPEVIHVEESSEWLGVPFMVVRAVEGVVADDNPPYLIDPNGWFLRGSPEDWKRLETSTVNVLVQLHEIVDDGEATAFLRLDAPGDTALAAQLASHREYYEWVRDGRTIPILEQAFEVLAATIPANDRSVLNWGDARPGNIIYQDFEPVGVLDWEMAGVGPPEVDVAWLTFFQRFYGSFADQYGLPPVPAVFGRAEVVGTYERLSGTALDDLAWYEALAGLHLGIVLARMSSRAISFGAQEPPDHPNGLIMFAPLLERLLADL
jgi:aminoglycoside phosphotransferase (APT) family kinase protein